MLLGHRLPDANALVMFSSRPRRSVLAFHVPAVPRSFRLRMELEHAEKGVNAADPKNANKPKDPHQGYVTYGQTARKRDAAAGGMQPDEKRA